MTTARTKKALATGMKEATSGSMIAFSDCGTQLEVRTCCVNRENQYSEAVEYSGNVLCTHSTQPTQFPLRSSCKRFDNSAPTHIHIFRDRSLTSPPYCTHSSSRLPLCSACLSPSLWLSACLVQLHPPTTDRKNMCASKCTWTDPKTRKTRMERATCSPAAFSNSRESRKIIPL
jgi:hypothetical protein